ALSRDRTQTGICRRAGAAASTGSTAGTSRDADFRGGQPKPDGGGERRRRTNEHGKRHDCRQPGESAADAAAAELARGLDESAGGAAAFSGGAVRRARKYFRGRSDVRDGGLLRGWHLHGERAAEWRAAGCLSFV